MALDLSLMEVAKTDGAGLLRIYGWSKPTVSFGRNERVAGVYETGELAEAGLDFVRRPTGGRALLHWREVTYSVAMPLGDQSRWPVAYEAVNQRLLAAMQLLGVPASISRVGHDAAPHAPPHAAREFDADAPVPDQGVVCFSGIAKGEIAVGERKLVASSVWRDRAAYLQHGSILIHDEQSVLNRVMGARIAPAEPGATLSEFLTGMSDEAIVNRTSTALVEAFEHCGKTLNWSIPNEVRRHVDVTRSALSDAAWLWRR